MSQIVTQETQNPQAVTIREQFAVDLRKQITTKRVIVGTAGVVGLAVALPVAIMAVQAGFALVAVGALAVGGYLTWRRVPLWIQRNENSITEASNRERNRHLTALKQDARTNPVEQLQNYLLSKKGQLDKYMDFVKQIGSQVKSTSDMLDERKRQKPDKDYSKKDQAVNAMGKAYQFHLQKVEAGKKALNDLKEAVEDAQFDWKFGQAGQAAMQNMKALEGQDLLNEMLASESFDAVRTNFNNVFSDIEVQIGTINSSKQLDFGEGIVIDVSNVKIPTMKGVQE